MITVKRKSTDVVADQFLLENVIDNSISLLGMDWGVVNVHCGYMLNCHTIKTTIVAFNKTWLVKEGSNILKFSPEEFTELFEPVK